MSKLGNILVLSAGRRVELVKAFKEGLDRQLPGAKVYTADMVPELSAACHISYRSFKTPRVTSAEYIDVILGICQKYEISLVIPTIDPELLIISENRLRFSEIGVLPIVSDVSFVKECRDKRNTGVLFKSLGISYPRIMDRNSLVFPCFCKPYDGSRSVGAKIIQDRSQLSPEVLENDKNMFMELVPETYCEYTVDAYYNSEHRLCGLVPRERIEVRDGEVSKGITRKNFVYHYLISKLSILPGAIGCITLQFFVNHQSRDIKGLEINPRFGGGYPLTHASGAKFVDWLIYEFVIGKSPSFFDQWLGDLLMLRYDASVLCPQ